MAGYISPHCLEWDVLKEALDADRERCMKRLVIGGERSDMDMLRGRIQFGNDLLKLGVAPTELDEPVSDASGVPIVFD